MPKDHFVPQFYLRNFETGGGFQVYNKKPLKSWQSNAYQTGKELNFYSFEDKSGNMDRQTEATLSQLEGSQAQAVKRLLEHGRAWNKKDRQLLIGLIASLFLRVPRQTNIVKDVLDKVSADQLESLATNPTVMARYLEDFPAETPESYGNHIREGSFPVGKGVEKIQSLAQIVPLYLALLKREGEFVTVQAPSDSEFLTSDNPVNVWWETSQDRGRFGAILQPDCQIWLPLSPRRGIYIGHDRSRVKHRDNAASFCARVNERIIWDAPVFVVSTAPASDVEAAVARCVAVNRDHLLKTMVGRQSAAP